jgi:Uma2 family endonuclease
MPPVVIQTSPPDYSKELPPYDPVYDKRPEWQCPSPIREIDPEAQESRQEVKDSVLPPYDPMYPDSDGNPMCDNTLQLQWMFALISGFKALFKNDPNIFITGDLLWYPEKTQPRVCVGPDVMIIFDRPPGHRRCYMQWKEEDIPPHIVFEIISQSNSAAEMKAKLAFYEKYGVEEYFVYDPDLGGLKGYLRTGDHLTLLPEMNGWISPRTGVSFSISGKDIVCIRPDGKKFETYDELLERANEEAVRADEADERAEEARLRAKQARQRAQEEHKRAEEERLRAEQAEQQAKKDRERAEEERLRAEQAQQKAKEERERAEEERLRADRLSAKLRELGIDPSSL